jgi:hypothetical protein
MEGHNSGSSKEYFHGTYDQFTPPLRKKLIKKLEATSIGDLVEAKFVIYGPALGLDGYGSSYASGPLGGTSGSQGIGVSSQKIYADLLDEIYGGPSVSVERGTLGVVLDKSSFNTFVHWMPKGPRWWIFPEEYNIVSTVREDTDRVSGSY